MQGKVVALLVVIALLVGSGGTYAAFALFQDESQGSEQSMTLGSGNDIESEELSKINKTYELITDRYVKDVEQKDLLDGAIKGMIETLDDPYSVYMDPKTAEQFSQSLGSSFEGIGAEVNMDDGRVTIVSPYKDSPAEKAGLRPNDKIMTIDGESTEGLDLYDAVLKIRGEKGTVVKLGVQRPGVSEVMEVKVTRDEIPIETVYSDTVEKNGKTIGVLQVTSFSENTAKSFSKELKKLENEGIDGLVLDVRNNPGGLLNVVSDMAEEIIPSDKPYVQIEDRQGEKQRSVSSLEEKKDYPIVGLIDRGSASAAEILAGALKEAGGYDLVGEKSFGKGTVQTTVDLGDGSNIKLTMFKWLTPDGNWIHKEGIEPTVEAEQPAYFYVNPLSAEKTLEFDQNNKQVESAQVMLKGLGFEPGRTDGYYSDKTVTAVKAFQRSNNINVSGKIDEKTAQKLQENIVDSIRNPDNDVQLETAVELLAK
ncbi:S41 family peptidase [Pseudalkalibacillus hwajinpoensis]|uniref:PDZ domain-containing protein n=1 Tax=Guptibacillus hwajinpoensis TaxID=208199 RepID=A0A4U1MID2_9BACL|nr:S41 family peptidase [Pseudalkalibacillus hwajinpoensis]TKD71109.1 PDZ domain-containing protein [Pseudalkalibacillus hwajinpoensis]